jgi:hypothetical protein
MDIRAPPRLIRADGAIWASVAGRARARNRFSLRG